MAPETRPTPTAPPWPGVLAGLGHLALLPLYASSGLLAPGPAVLGLLVLWAALAVVVVRARRRWRVLLVPPAAAALWYAVLTAGEQLLGWTG